jgi:hypothetical protein
MKAPFRQLFFAIVTLMALGYFSGCDQLPLSSSGLSTNIEQFVGGRSNGEAFGASSGFVDDLNGDGLIELVVGAPDNNERGLDSGCIYLFLSPLAIAINPKRVCGQAGEKFGGSVLSPGDLNGDGVADIVAGGAGQNPGKVYVFSGARLAALEDDETPSSIDADLIINGQASGIAGVDLAEFGSKLAAVDFNRDGRIDLAVSDPQASGGGAVFVFYGGQSLSSFTDNDGIVIFAAAAELKLTADSGNANFGAALSHAGDVNGDFGGPTSLVDRFGDDLLVGAPAGDAGGRAYLFLGNDGIQGNFVASTFIAAAVVERSVAQFGLALAAPGDMSGDGLDDFAVGYLGGTIIFQGFVEIGLLEGFEVAIEADQPADSFGTVLGGARGIGLEPASGLMVGAPTDSLAGPDMGVVYLFSAADVSALFNFGSTLFATANATQLLRATNFTATVSRMLGKSISYDGDLDNNGSRDAVLGAPEFDEIGLDSGAIFIEF